MFRRYSRRIIVVTVIAIAIGLTVVGSRLYERPRTLSASEVPIAFWHWRTPAPEALDISNAVSKARMQKLFLRAGQFELKSDAPTRIQPMTGAFPSGGVELYLVYNATPKLLREFEQTDQTKLAAAIADTYHADLERANRDRAKVLGLQIDFDVPTRLLLKYAELLKSLRSSLPPDTNVSITGLPSWIESNDLDAVLEVVNFWIPQFYGSEIPATVDRKIAISSPADVARYTSRVRRLGRPFYAGISSYGYAILYGMDGSLVEVRGNIDPRGAERNSDLELVERSTFPNSDEARVVYRVRRDSVFHELTMRPGETLVFDIPSTKSLQAAARAVRENAGDQLLGICIFRLPSGYDKTNLSIDEITTALNSN